MKAWIGVDLDGTLAMHDKWQGPGYIGAPIPAMVQRVRQVLAAGYQVKVFTARMANEDLDVSEFLQAWIKWSQENFGQVLEATCKKDYGMVELWDDRAVAVETNTGQFLSLSQLIR